MVSSNATAMEMFWWRLNGHYNPQTAQLFYATQARVAHPLIPADPRSPSHPSSPSPQNPHPHPAHTGGRTHPHPDPNRRGRRPSPTPHPDRKALTAAASTRRPCRRGRSRTRSAASRAPSRATRQLTASTRTTPRKCTSGRGSSPRAFATLSPRA
eukprot:6694840-Prymnesium_polylepis.1